MKIAAGILCWNHDKTGRGDLFDLCHKSLQEAAPDVLRIMDNGSVDGTAEKVEALPGGFAVPRIEGYPPANTCGYGMDKLAASLLMDEPDIIVLSNDDIVWAPDSMDRLRAVWSEAPEDVAIISGLVEPLFSLPDDEPWNKVLGPLDVAGERLWLRKSVPGGAWTFRTSDFVRIFPVSTFPGIDDVPACKKLAGRGLRVACMDLAEHQGIERSSWGNGSHRQYLIQTVDEWQAEW